MRPIRRKVAIRCLRDDRKRTDDVSVTRQSLPAIHRGLSQRKGIALALGEAPLLLRIASFNAYQEGWALYAERLAAEIELAAGLPEAALQRLPQEAGRPELVLRTQALLRVGRPAEVTGALQTWVVTHPHDAAAWQLLASAWQAQGQPLRAVRAEAESHAARYDYAAAVDRFKAGQDLARKSSSAADYIEASIIDTRLRAMELLLKEQAAER